MDEGILQLLAATEEKTRQHELAKLEYQKVTRTNGQIILILNAQSDTLSLILEVCRAILTKLRVIDPDDKQLSVLLRMIEHLTVPTSININQTQRASGGDMSDNLSIGGDVKNLAYKPSGPTAQATDQATATATQINVEGSVHEAGLKHIEPFMGDGMPSAEATALKQRWLNLKPVIDQAEETGEATDSEVEQVEGFFQHLVRFSYEKRWEIVEGFTDVFTPLPSKLVSLPGRYLEEKLRGIQTGEA